LACPWLDLAARAHSSAHSTKGTPSPDKAGSDWPEAHGFRIYFTPLAGVLFTVPSRYWCTIGRWPYLALGGGPPSFNPDFACPDLLPKMNHVDRSPVAYRTLTRSGDPFQRSSAQQSIHAKGLPPPPSIPDYPDLASPAGCTATSVWAPPRSLAATEGILSFPQGTEMFQFPRCPPAFLLVAGRAPARLPHSDTSGSQAASASPEHFAAWPRPSSAATA
jgi:hypothetical protein